MRLIAEDLSGERGGQAVFSGVNLRLGRGEALVVSGPNGSGKSTLLRVIAGLLAPATGRVILEGGGEAMPTVASAAHYIGHRNAMKPTLTVSENLAFWRSFHGDDGLSDDDALERVGLSPLAHIPYGYLSTGQKRRTSIARLLVSHRPLWLLDEPTAGLDSESEVRCSDIMTEHRDNGGMIVAATHLPLGLGDVTELRMGNRAGRAA